MSHFLAPLHRKNLPAAGVTNTANEYEKRRDHHSLDCAQDRDDDKGVMELRSWQSELARGTGFELRLSRWE